MAIEVKVPSLGESITSGILANWHVKDGDAVEKDQVIYELETDKITSEGLAEAAGVITLKAGEGDEVEIGQVLALIEEGASATAPSAPSDSESTSEEPDGEPSAADDSDTGESPDGGSHPALSPAVRKLIEENNLDPAAIKGSGKEGRLTKGDVQDFLKQQSSTAAAAPGPAKPVAAKPAPAAEPSSTPPRPESSSERVTRRKLSPLRRKIGERLVMAQRQAAILTTFNEVDMSGIMNLRKEHQDSFVKKHEIKLGFMSFFCKAVVHALKEVPQLNAQIDGDTLIENHFYDIGVAIGTERGLIVPVLRDVDQLSFAGIEKEIIHYAQLSKEGKISVDDLQGGVFTISNGGVYGSLLSTPILNPPQSGILGMHTIQQRPVAVDGQVVIRPMMYLALSYDHRIVDGKEAVTFLIRIKEAIENPTRLLFEI